MDPSTSMRARSDVNSGACRRQTSSRASFMAAWSVSMSGSVNRRQKSPAVVESGIASTPSAFRWASSCRRSLMSSSVCPPQNTLYTRFRTWSDSWYGRWIFSTRTRSSMRRGRSRCFTNWWTAPRPPWPTAVTRSAISYVTLPAGKSGRPLSTLRRAMRSLRVVRRFLFPSSRAIVFFTWIAFFGCDRLCCNSAIPGFPGIHTSAVHDQLLTVRLFRG
jgi:hypothetical protein